MSDWPRFPNAPITEAIIDLGADLPADVSLDSLQAFAPLVEDEFPDSEERATSGFRLNLGTTSATAERTVQGRLYRSADQRYAVQARIDGFSFHWMKPYDSWDAFAERANDLWQRYLRVAKPTQVKRIATRFINRIELPLPIEETSDYLLAGPSIPPGMPQLLQSFLLRVVLQDPTRNALATVSQLAHPVAPDAKTLPLILDIDAVCEAPIEPTSDAVWNKLAELRDLKNEIFFNSFTDKTKELFR